MRFVTIFNVLFLSGFVFAAYGQTGVFKPVQVVKALKISMASKKFLQSMIEKQELFLQQRLERGKQDQFCVQLVDKMLVLYKQVVEQAVIDPALYDMIVRRNMALKKELLAQYNQIYFSAPDKIWFDWFVLVQQALDQLHIYAHDNDVAWLKQQLKMFSGILKSHDWDNDLLQKIVMRIFELCNELINQFDGTFIDDYDILILSNLIVVIMILRC